ncbi:Nuclear transcription factor Y subunit [Musa troglodytarum]|uniref:Nuclear transcription factor Y subunit n=1 Tax=Musa troglodytarum TaxID=320322 RepID=A0A9E7JIW1_9LILI|nr:Nuclear transcription factor Y subunit [Musa troglodytarum]
MEQPSQPSQPVTGIVSGIAQVAYAAPSYQPAALVTGAQAVTGAMPHLTQLASAYPINPVNLASPHQLVYRHVQQFQHRQQQQLRAFWANQMSEIEQATDFKNHSLPLARVKKIMKADEDVHMISADAPVVFAKACEMLILELTLRSWIHTEENKRRTLLKNDVTAALSGTGTLDFLVDIVPRDELNAALPAVGAPAESIPDYYLPASQMTGSGMNMGKPIDQTARSVAYMWRQPQAQPLPLQHHQQATDGE